LNFGQRRYNKGNGLESLNRERNMPDPIPWKILSLLGLMAASGLLVLTLVPSLGYWAAAIGLVDRPDSTRKLHARPIPLVGGLAIFLATAIVVWLGVAYLDQWLAPDARQPLAFSAKHLGLLTGGALILLVGVMDDRYKLRGRYKFLGQVVVATHLIACGYFFDQVQVGPYRLEFGVFAVLVVYFWILGAINSVNLLDGADGFAGTLGFVVSLSLAVMAFFGKETAVEAVIAAALAGAIGGFLWFNLPPARIYLGDGGSMLIGMAVGALAISTALKEQTLYAFMAPIAMLAIPIMDSALAIVRRQLTRRGIYAVDRGHLHHRLLGQGMSPRTAVACMAVMCAATAIGGVASFLTQESEYAAVTVAAVVGFLIFGRICGFAEFSMVGQRVRQFSWGLAGIRWAGDTPATEEFQLQGTRDWGHLLRSARSFVENHGLEKLTIDVNAPWLHESYHAVWKSKATRFVESHGEWSAEFPLILQDRVYGRVEVMSLANAAEAYRCLPKLMDLLESAGLQVLGSSPLTAAASGLEPASSVAGSPQTPSETRTPPTVAIVDERINPLERGPLGLRVGGTVPHSAKQR
jgi:UDP-GlcNAc:undecaprenyl-phosphate GlcNAc-1-phosphate transferase